MDGIQHLARSTEDRTSALLAGVSRVAAQAAQRAEEIDRQGAFPPELYDELEATGAFRCLAPQVYGGLELPFSVANEAISIGARAYGSLGWLLMVGTSQSFALGLHSEKTLARLFQHRPDIRLRGAVAPRGIAVPVEGGYRVNGQWPFASGGPDPDYIGGSCIVFVDGQPRIGAAGLPDIVSVFMPAGAVEPLDTWHVLGMRGTNSCDYVAKDLFVPEDMCVNVLTAKNNFDTTAMRLPSRVSVAMGHAAVALGTAQGALDDIIELSKTKRPALNPMALLAADPVFQHGLGEQTLRLAAVQALLDQRTASQWQCAVDKRELSVRERLVGRSLAAYITAECAKVVDWAFTAAGGSAVYNKSSLQRRLRDIHTATQHVMVGTDAYRLVGSAYLDQDIPPIEMLF